MDIEKMIRLKTIYLMCLLQIPIVSGECAGVTSVNVTFSYRDVLDEHNIFTTPHIKTTDFVIAFLFCRSRINEYNAAHFFFQVDHLKSLPTLI